MKRLYFLLALIILGCEKENILEPIPPVEQNCITCYDEFIDYNVESWKLDFPMIHKKYYHSVTPNGPDWGPPIDFLVVDYDHDGYLDAVTGDSDYTAGFAGLSTRRTFKFFKGDADGNLIYDTRPEYMNIVGPAFGAKSFIGDYNLDGKPDLVFVGSGHDDQTGQSTESWKDAPIILMSNSEGFYDRFDYPEAAGSYHAGASADIDYDGDLDIVLPRFKTMINRGNGTFDIVDFPIETLDDPTTLELVDLDRNGTIEFVYGSGSMYQPPGAYRHSSWVSNIGGNKIIIPHVDNFGIFVDANFIDLDGDGTLEIIISRATDQNHPKGHWRGWYNQVVKYTSSGVVDVTDQFIEDYEYVCGDNCGELGKSWVHWFNLSTDELGDTYFFADDGIAKARWKLTNGKFKRVL